mgnify:CR=1 FL=1
MDTIRQVDTILQAIEIGSTAIVRQLIADGHDANESSESGTYPIVAAASRNDFDMVKLLLSEQCDPNVKDAMGRTAVGWATKWKNDQMLTLLHEHLQPPLPGLSK